MPTRRAQRAAHLLPSPTLELIEAEAYRKLIGEFHHSQEALGRIVGKSRSHVANLLRLLELPEDVARFLASRDDARVLDFFALVDGCLARGSADPDVVRDFLLFYYVWWRDEIMDPLRRTGPCTKCRRVRSRRWLASTGCRSPEASERPRRRADRA